MLEKSRSRMLEVSVTPRVPPGWEWEVTSNGEVLANGFENGEVDAKFKGNSAMFELLAAGWSPSPKRRSTDAWHDRRVISDHCRSFHAAIECGSYDAFVDEFVADRQTAFCYELSHSGRRARSAR